MNTEKEIDLLKKDVTDIRYDIKDIKRDLSTLDAKYDAMHIEQVVLKQNFANYVELLQEMRKDQKWLIKLVIGAIVGAIMGLLISIG